MNPSAAASEFGWGSILRLGLVQTALGAMVVLATSTFNRVMVVELALPAILPGLLVALHYVVQVFRPRMGHGADVGGRSTPWILGGMAVLGLSTLAAAAATALLAESRTLGTMLGVVAYLGIGAGAGAAGTSLLVLLAKRVAPVRRAGAASAVWLMMIAGFAITATTAGRFLDPYGPTRLLAVTACVVGIAWALTVVALARLEGKVPPGTAVAAVAEESNFRAALRDIWQEAHARRFTIFVFVSMLAYSAQDLILEPFAGLVFGNSVGESTTLSGIQHQGVFFGMLAVAVACRVFNGRLAGSLKFWTVVGCMASATALWALASASLAPTGWPLRATVLALGLANGAYAVAAIGSMMANAGRGAPGREGIRMGLWGAAQGVAFGLGGFLGTLASDVARALLQSVQQSYALVFSLEGALFLFSALLAARLDNTRAARGSLQRRSAFG